VKSLPTFAGPRCRVELVLRPDCIPCLEEGQKKDGTYAGFLDGPDGEVVLVARNLKFKKDVKDGEERNGLVYLNVDGFDRAFTFLTTFAPDGQPTDPQRIEKPVLRLVADPYTRASAKYRMTAEADNVQEGWVVELGLDRDDDKQFVANQGEVVRFPNGRETRYFFSPVGPHGGLVAEASVRDWSWEPDLSGLFGKRALRLQLLGPQQKVREVIAGAPAGPGAGIRVNSPVTEVDGAVIVDGSKPDELRFIDLPRQLRRGSPLPIRARAVDAESGIRQVVFFVGKSLPDGKVPDGAVVAQPVNPADRTVWQALLPAPTERAAVLEVTVQATNNVGLSATETVIIQLVDPTPGAPAAAATIRGMVSQGGRPQPDVPVTLRDAQNAIKNKAMTNSAGEYVFKDVPPASYRVEAISTRSMTRGDTAVQVAGGEEKTKIDINLTR
jgi:hypothetical protein